MFIKAINQQAQQSACCKQTLNYDLNAENAKTIKSSTNSNVDVAGNYKNEIKKNNWDTQKGFDIQFVIKKK